jgi:hypothetical protein
MRRPLLLAPLAIALIVGAFAASAAGSTFSSLYREYLTTGGVNGCAHSQAELQAGLTSIPADIQAYDPGFADSLNAAIDQRTLGCSSQGQAQAPPSHVPAAADGSPRPGRVPVSGPSTLPGSGPSSLPLIGLFGLAILAAAGFAVALVRR